MDIVVGLLPSSLPRDPVLSSPFLPPLLMCRPLFYFFALLFCPSSSRIMKVQILRDAQWFVEIVNVFVNEDSGDTGESYNIYHPARYWNVGMSKPL